jgi:hypothetical protein
LAKWQKNDVFEVIKKIGLRPEDFDWQGGGDDDRLADLASKASFDFGGDTGHYHLAYAAEDTAETELDKYTWAGVLTSVEVWLGSVKLDRETPDLWAELSRHREMLGPAPGKAGENTPFSAVEQREVGKRLRDTKEYVKGSYALSEDQVIVLDDMVAYMEEAGARLGRIDWRNAAAGAMLGALVSAAIPPEVVRAFLNMLFEGIGHFFALMP